MNRTAVAVTGNSDENGNPVPTDGLASTATSTSTNRISAFTYDRAGNVIRGQNASGVWQVYEYDAAGRLKEVEDDSNNDVEVYTYGAGRQKLVVTAGSDTTYYVWGGSSIVAEYLLNSSNPRYQKAYVYAGSRLLMTTERASGTTESRQTHHPDRLGTKRVTNIDSGAEIEQSTLPFGTAFGAESSGYSNQVFTSYDRSPATGLDYANNRTYSSGQGRFTQVDPIGMASASIGNPQSNNLYAYTQNMPTDFVDPSGLNVAAPGSGQSGILWTWMHFRNGELVAFRQWFEAYPGSGDGSGDGGGGVQSNPRIMPLNCRLALTKAGLLPRVNTLLGGAASYYDVNAIKDQPASRYFGSDYKGQTVEQVFDARGSTATTVTGAGVRAGIYARGGEAILSPLLRLHEVTHLAQGLQGQTGDLDVALARTLGLSSGNASKVVSAYFNSLCNSSWLKRATTIQ